MNKIFVLVALLLLVVPGASALTLNVLTTDPAPLQAGSLADITVELESSVSEVQYTDLEIDILESEVIQVISSTQGEFASFRPGRVATFTLRVLIAENTPEGFIDLDFVAQSNELNQEFTQRVFVESAETQPELLIGQLRSTPQELLPDTDDNQLQVTVQNLGDKDAELVRAELIVPEGITASYSYSLEDSVASVASGAQETFLFDVDLADTVRESVQARLELRYRAEEAGTSNYETYTVSLPVTLAVVPAPLLEITNVEYLDDFVGGSSDNEVRVAITNTGNVAAEEVRVRVAPDISYPFIFAATTQYVSSSIKPGETAYVVFTAEVTDEAQAQSYAITTKLESLVGEARYTREDVLRLETSVGEGVANSTIAYAVIGVVLILALVIGIRARKRK